MSQSRGEENYDPRPFPPQAVHDEHVSIETQILDSTPSHFRLTQTDSIRKRR
jgi:hypothetical protein